MPHDREPALTPKQQQLVPKYPIDLSAAQAQAAIRAGYAPAVANRQGRRLLSDAVISDRIRTKTAQKGQQRARLLCIVAVAAIGLAVQANAAVLNFIGWESGGTDEVKVSSGTVSVQTGTVRTGSYALEVNPAADATGYQEIQKFAADGTDTGLNAATAWHRFYFRYASKPSSADEPFAQCVTAATGLKAEFRLDSTGKIKAYDATATLLATGTATLNAATWYRLELKCGSSATVGVVEVTVDGAVDISTTGNTSATVNGGITLGKQTDRTAANGAVDFFYDDYQADDAVYPGVGKVKVLIPTADGAAVTWTIGAGAGSKWQQIDDIPNNGDTDYLLSTGTTGDAYTATVQTAAAGGITGTVGAVKSFTTVKRSGAVNGSALSRLRSNTTTNDTVGASTLAAYGGRSKVYTTDPATTAAWTLSGLNTLEVGAVENQTGVNTTRLTQALVMVSFDDTAAAPTCNGGMSMLGAGRGC